MESRSRNMVVQEHGITYVRANPATPFTAGEKARRFAMVATTVLAIAAVALVLGGFGNKVRVTRNLYKIGFALLHSISC
jgi:hypothetical protein